MAGPSILNSSNPLQSQINHSGQVYRPQSCSGISNKIANLDRTIAAAESHFNAEMKRLQQWQNMNFGLLVAQITKDTCVAFLDLGANMLEIVGLKSAAEVANQGLNAIQIAETRSNLAAGHISPAQASLEYAKVAPLPTMGSSTADAALNYTKDAHVGAAQIMVQSSGQSKAEQNAMAQSYVKDQLAGVADIIAAAGKEANQPWGNSLGKIMNGVKAFSAAQTYDQNLTKAFDSYLDDKTHVQGLVFNLELQFRNKFTSLKKQMLSLKIEFETCLAQAETPAGKPFYEFSSSSTPVWNAGSSRPFSPAY